MTYGDGEVRAHIAIACDFLDSVGIGEFFNPGTSYNSLGIATIKALTYEDEYLKYMSESLWNVVLKDRSIIQFKFESKNPRSHLSYVYMESPFVFDKLEQFVTRKRIEIGDASLSKELFQEDYEEYLANPDVNMRKPHVTPIRYDYSPALHASGCHPASHVHFGHRSNIRVATGRLLRPSSFACLIARQCYPDDWKEYRSNHPEEASHHCNQVHAALATVPNKYLRTPDLEETGFDLPRIAAPPTLSGAAESRSDIPSTGAR